MYNQSLAIQSIVLDGPLSRNLCVAQNTAKSSASVVVAAMFFSLLLGQGKSNNLPIFSVKWATDW